MMKSSFFRLLAGGMLFMFVACNSEPSSTKDKPAAKTEANKEEEEDTEISVGPDGASLQTKNTDVKISSEGASVGTKDVNIKASTRDTTKK